MSATELCAGASCTVAVPRAMMQKDGGVQVECLLVEPLTISLSMQRNLSAAWYHDKPDIELSGALEPLTVSLSAGLQCVCVLWCVYSVCVCVCAVVHL